MDKICKHCDQTKPLDEFPKDRSRPEGVYSYCKECCRQKTAAVAMTPPRRTPTEGMKWCGVCKKDLAVTEFYAAKKTYDGLARRCKACSLKKHEEWRLKNKDKAAKYMREWYGKNKTKARDSHLKKLYKMPYGEFDKMLDAQNGKCAICNREDPKSGNGRLCVDHCHDTGAVRELLCSHCNSGLGYFENNMESLESAIKYLKKHSGAT